MKQRSQPLPLLLHQSQANDPPGPLRDVAWWIGHLGSRFWHLWNEIKGVWLIGPYLAWPFYQAYERCYWAAHYLTLADSRFESLSLDEFIESAKRWVLRRMGMGWWESIIWENHIFAWLLYRYGLSTADALLFESSPIFWIRLKVHERWPFLEDILSDSPGWIKGKLTSRWLHISTLLDFPGQWVRDRLEGVWGEFNTIRTHPVAWVLLHLGADPFWAYYYESDPLEWVYLKLQIKFPFLRTLYTDPYSQVWEWFRGAVDRYLDQHADWVISTVSRVLNLIWQARV